MKNKFIKINLIILIIFAIIPFNIHAEEITSAPEEQLMEEEREETEAQVQEQEVQEQVQEEPQEEPQELTELDELELQKSGLEEDITLSNEQIDVVHEQVTEAVYEMVMLNQTICDKQLEIDTKQAEIKNLLVTIGKAEEDLARSNERYENQKALLEKRLVATYEIGETSYLEFLLSSKNISDFLSKFYLLSQVLKTDDQLLELVQYEKQYNENLKKSLETQRLRLQQNQDTMEKNKIALENMVTLKNARINQLNDEERTLNRIIEEYQNSINEIETEIRILALANIGADYVGGVMAWPVPGYTKITSPFGMRTHPVTGVYKLHTGTDIGAPYGASFVAANDGVVSKAGYNRAYGNMVIIDHGGGIQTLYAHGSQILVQTGDVVRQGQEVLKVGSTGYSTGAHAHFEVRINGEYVNPLDYITSYSNKAQETEQVILNN